MSYRLAFFGVPAATPFEEVLAQVRPMARELRAENGYREVYLATCSDDEAQRIGLRPSYFAAPGAHGHVPRGFFVERWNGPLFEIVYDDQHGLFLWRHYTGDGGVHGILSDGPFVGLHDLAPNCDYPQKSFSNQQLEVEFQKSEAQLKAQGLLGYHDAITIGLRHYGFEMTRQALLQILFTTNAWPLLTGSGAQPLPSDVGPIASSYVDFLDFRAHGLKPREY